MPPLPAEVCQTILRYSIYVPGLFDTDAFEGDLMAFGFGELGDELAEKSYWRAEKTRNKLRRVCWAWNEYLIRFEHRFVSMLDVWHGEVDKMFLKNAIRISFDTMSCLCPEVCVIPSPDASSAWLIYRRFAAFCRKTIQPFGFLPAEIVDICQHIANESDIIDMMRFLKRAKVLVSWKFYPSSFFFTETANLEHILGSIQDVWHSGLTAQNLVTVSFEWYREAKVVVELPSLRHLRIDYGHNSGSSEYWGPALASLLQEVGDQLRSLYIHSGDRSHQMQVDIWGICPNLERFHPGPVLAVSPPPSHPLHTLSVMPNHLSHAATLQFPKLRRLILDGWWDEIGSQGVTYLVSIRTTSLIDRVTVEDLDGVPLADAPEDTDTALTRKLASIQL